MDVILRDVRLGGKYLNEGILISSVSTLERLGFLAVDRASLVGMELDTEPGMEPSRRDQILQTALRLFRKQGYEATSTREIAEVVGTSKANVYHHFRTKDGLLHGLLDPLFEKVEALLDRHEPAPNGSPEQRAMLEEYFDLILENKELVSMLASDMAVLTHPEISRRTLQLNDRLLELVAGSEADVEGQVRAACALGSLQTVVARFFQADKEAIRVVGIKTALGALGVQETG